MEKLMKKGIVPLVAIILVLSMLVGCSGTPKPPVGNLEDLDELVTLNMTLDQVYALMKPSLRQTSTLYQVESIQQTASGNWRINNKEGGFAANEAGSYQALWFTPVKTGDEYYMIAFKGDVVMGKAFFVSTNAYYVEQLLKGNNPVNTSGQ
jgi:hypothetical protein